MTAPLTTRRCPKCGKDKPRRSFWKNGAITVSCDTCRAAKPRPHKMRRCAICNHEKPRAEFKRDSLTCSGCRNGGPIIQADGFTIQVISHGRILVNGVEFRRFYWNRGAGEIQEITRDRATFRAGRSTESIGHRRGVTGSTIRRLLHALGERDRFKHGGYRHGVQSQSIQREN